MVTDKYFNVIDIAAFLLIASSAMAADYINSSNTALPETANKQLSNEPATTHADNVATDNQKRAIEQYQQVIKDLESAGGVYQVQLSENLTSIGAAYQSGTTHQPCQ